MISLSPAMRIFVATEPADFRRGIDGLAALCRQRLEQDPMSGCAFVFRNRRGTAIKILLYDGQGFWLCQKRLSQGRFLHWPTGDTPTLGDGRLAPEAAACWLWGVFLRQAEWRPREFKSPKGQPEEDSLSSSGTFIR